LVNGIGLMCIRPLKAQEIKTGDFCRFRKRLIKQFQVDNEKIIIRKYSSPCFSETCDEVLDLGC